VARVLIVDDDRVAASIAKAIAEAAKGYVHTPFGIKPTIATTVQEARGYLHQFNYELIIVDAMLAKDNDWALIKEVRATHDKFALPIIVTAPFESVKLSFAAVTAGANSWITKPFQPEQLSSVLSIMCEGR
jgi:DNA-binding response OmpR family regulator